MKKVCAMQFLHFFVLCYGVCIFIKPFFYMQHRRIAIYLEPGKPTAKVQLNHLYSQKIGSIIYKTGESKTEIARRLLMDAFQTVDLIELRERIIYAADIKEETLTAKRKIAEVCKRAIKLSIDKGLTF
jgi:hypothetical protein